MNTTFELLNFSFRGGKLCLYIKDYINNIHYIHFETGHLTNNINNYLIKTLYGFGEDYFGRIHVVVTNFVGLYSILDKKMIEFNSTSKNGKHISLDVSTTSDRPNLLIKQYTESVFVLVYYPTNRLLNSDDGEDLGKDYYSRYIDSFTIDEIFKNNILTANQFYAYLGDKGVDVVKDDFDFRTEEEIEYDSIDDDDTKRDAFPDLWLDEQVNRAYKDDENIKIFENEANYEELVEKFTEIKVIDFNNDDIWGHELPYVTLLVPSKFTHNKRSQQINIKLEKIAFHDKLYFEGGMDNIVVTVISKQPDGVGIGEDCFINIEELKSETGMTLENGKDFGFEMIYVKVIDDFEFKINEFDDRPF